MWPGQARTATLHTHSLCSGSCVCVIWILSWWFETFSHSNCSESKSIQWHRSSSSLSLHHLYLVLSFSVCWGQAVQSTKRTETLISVCICVCVCPTRWFLWSEVYVQFCQLRLRPALVCLSFSLALWEKRDLTFDAVIKEQRKSFFIHFVLVSCKSKHSLNKMHLLIWDIKSCFANTIFRYHIVFLAEIYFININ